MSENMTLLKLLLVDDEEDFRKAICGTLARRGFEVSEAGSGEEALESVERSRPDVVVLDLRMPGMDGIETLKRIREIHADLPVIILTGHGDFDSAMAGIKLRVIDFVQKPVDPGQLALRIRRLLEHKGRGPLRERTVGELMIAPSHYPRIYSDQPVTAALDVLRERLFAPPDERSEPERVRSALVFDRHEKFLGILRFGDLLKLVVPSFLGDSPYTTFFTGMFLAQCKVITNRHIAELLAEPVTVDIDAPLMQAVHLMARYRLTNLPVLSRGELVGVLREREIIAEIALSREL